MSIYTLEIQLRGKFLELQTQIPVWGDGWTGNDPTNIKPNSCI